MCCKVRCSVPVFPVLFPCALYLYRPPLLSSLIKFKNSAVFTLFFLFFSLFFRVPVFFLRFFLLIAGLRVPTNGGEQEEETAQFITYRNNLNKILVSPYSKQKWEMEVRPTDLPPRAITI